MNWRWTAQRLGISAFLVGHLAALTVLCLRVAGRRMNNLLCK